MDEPQHQQLKQLLLAPHEVVVRILRQENYFLMLAHTGVLDELEMQLPADLWRAAGAIGAFVCCGGICGRDTS